MVYEDVGKAGMTERRAGGEEKKSRNNRKQD